MSNSIFPFSQAEQYIRRMADNVRRTDRGLVWQSHDGISQLEVRSVDEKTHDELIVSEIVTLTHTSRVLERLPLEAIAQVNTWATISSLVVAGMTGPTRLVSKAGVFSEDRQAAEVLYAPFICTQAGLIGWHAAHIGRGIFRREPGQSSILHGAEDPSPLGPSDYEMAKDLTDRQGFLGTLSNNGFTVEFPWDPGAVSQSFRDERVRERWLKDHAGDTADDLDQMGGRTILFRVFESEHPLYGRGILSLLEIPLPIEMPAVVQLVNGLNHWELSTADLAPLFGSWSVGQRAPTFVTFLPNQFCRPGIICNLTIWAQTRAHRVREWLAGRATANP